MMRTPPGSTLLPTPAFSRLESRVGLTRAEEGVRSGGAEARRAHRADEGRAEALLPGHGARSEVDRRSAEAEIGGASEAVRRRDRKSTRLNSSHSQISYAVFC